MQIEGCVPEFEAWEAGVAAHCDMDKWYTPGGYTSQFKAQVVAWYRLHNAIKNHASDASAEDTKRKSRK